MPHDWEKRLIYAINRFLEWANRTPLDPTQEAWTALDLVTDLYCCARRINVNKCGEILEGYSVDDRKWQEIFDRFSGLPFQIYSHLINPLAIPPESPVVGCGCIADDLADIYRDVQEGMNLYQSGHRIEALWHWHFYFHHHWGAHAVWAMSVLHEFCTDNPDLSQGHRK